MGDNFEHGDRKYLTWATAYYYVIEWYSEPQDDIGKGRCDAWKLKTKLESSDGKQAKDEDVAALFKAWLGNTKHTWTVWHGAMYEVNWNIGEKP
ncbi:unnamed protein product [Clonostachys rosea f. rosea IK726]|uniref:Uncharacterized protein n=1 Tax=Clonostachys rosea f. rosea IK726 TaxID=1349383 RepID=A0ACA9TQF9_BIOOC|nr:unnamed protein product [Clonostachys rosea f. rosea IK726]